MAEEETQQEMAQKMEAMIGSMSAEEKRNILKGLVSKLTEGVDTQEMMPTMMMSMMGSKGEMKKKMAKVMQGGEESESMMPKMMLSMMMPHCIKTMMPAISKDKRVKLASKLVGTVVEQASNGMSGKERASFVAKIVEAVMLSTNKRE